MTNTHIVLLTLQNILAAARQWITENRRSREVSHEGAFCILTKINVLNSSELAKYSKPLRGHSRVYQTDENLSTDRHKILKLWVCKKVAIKIGPCFDTSKTDASFFIAPVTCNISAIHTIDKNSHYNDKYDCQYPCTSAHKVP